MYGCESGTIKKAKPQSLRGSEDHAKSWWTARSNQSILKEIDPEYSLEGLMLKLKFFGHLSWRADSLEKTLMLGKTEGKRRRGPQRMRWLERDTNTMDMNLSQLQETAQDRAAWRAAVHGATKRCSLTTEQQ